MRQIEYDNSKNAFIAMRSPAAPGQAPKPLLVDGRYVPRTFDWWLVVSVLSIENWIGLPVVGKQHPPDINMKPHEGSSYP